MILSLTILLNVIAAALLVPALVFFVEIVTASGRRQASMAPAGDSRPIVAILVPAHDEAAGIGRTLRTIMPQLRASDRLVVIADNCSDNTAAIAAAEGAEVVQRTDKVRRGKGYALDFGVRYLRTLPVAPQVVIVIDADCQVGAGAIERLAALSLRTSRPAQALYLMSAPEGAGANMRIAQFAWAVKNQLRPAGLRRLGLPCQLMGTGMSFPWERIVSAELATGEIVEDLKLGVDLALGGAPPLFCPEALVTSQFPTSREGIRTQRTRWEHGHLRLIITQVPRLLRGAFTSGSLNLTALALDLCVPPLALLVLLIAVMWFTTVAFFALTASSIPLTVATAAAVLLGTAVLLAWWRCGREIISAGGLALAFMYPLRKLPVYAKFLVARQIDWVRSKRDHTQS